MANVLSQSDQAGAPNPEPPRDPLSIPSEVKASIRVLVVDDERTLRESCASVLQMDGYNVTVIGRGEEAIETGLAAVQDDDSRLIAESADLLYHLLVLLEARGVTLVQVEAAHEKRTAQTGHEEKASRSRG